MTVPALRYFEARTVAYRHTWKGSAFSTFVSPVMYLFAMGLGLGSMIAGIPYGDETVTYVAFLAPGLLAATAMQTAAGDSAWPVLAGIKWLKTYQAVLATPLSPRDLLLGHLTFGAARVTLTSTVFATVVALFGVAPLWRTLPAVAPAVLSGVAFATLMAAYAARLHSERGLSAVFRFGIVPMFLFSDTFFPLAQLPDAVEPIASVIPLWHGVQLARAVMLGGSTPWPWWMHMAVLVGVIGAGLSLALWSFRTRMVR